MRISIYQIDPCKDTHKVRYLSHHGMSIEQEVVNPKIYDKVFEGNVDTTDLEKVFYIFNVSPIPYGYSGSSMSVSDVVETVDDETGELHWWYCNSVGFLNIDSEWISGLEKVRDCSPVLDCDIENFCFGGD